jgi:DNA-binding XRE family transcriptional regulator
MLTTTESVASSGLSSEDDRVLSLIVDILMGWPSRDRNALLAFLDFWRELAAEERAIFAKAVKPDLTEEEVACLAGVSRRTIYRWERYQGFKPRLAMVKATRPKADSSKRWRSTNADDAA